jgi:hypothetical protein
VLIQAVQHVRRMRGGAQSHLMRCADGFYYVVKFQNNPQHSRVLVNDWLGTRLAELIGLPVPVAAIVDVHPWLLEHTPDLRIELCGHRTMFTPGLSFGSRYVVEMFGMIGSHVAKKSVDSGQVGRFGSSRHSCGPPPSEPGRQSRGLGSMSPRSSS